MNILVCIDDTDDLSSRGTGKVAQLMAEGLAEKGWAECGAITRHQLLVHPDIAYTSHNSTMCFPARIADDSLHEVTEWCKSAVADAAVETADPGLCVVDVASLDTPGELVRFGLSAKERVRTKDEAYSLAESLGVHLSEHGGTGIGVIGALAGAGLRLSGNDGRFRGKVFIPAENGVASVAAILDHGADEVRTREGDSLPRSERVEIEEISKFVLLDGRAVMLVEQAEPDTDVPWRAVDRESLRVF